MLPVPRATHPAGCSLLPMRLLSMRLLAMRLLRPLWTWAAVLGFAALASTAAAQTVRLQTSAGDIDIVLAPDKAPVSVANFLAYVKAGHYDGVIFHRVINGFMIQTGGYSANLKEKSTRAPIALESDNGLSNVRGTVAMARTSDPNSATAQFYINVADNLFLDKPNARDGRGYAVFGSVSAGMEAVDTIKAVPTGSKGMFQNLPLEPITIRKASIVVP